MGFKVTCSRYSCICQWGKSRATRRQRSTRKTQGSRPAIPGQFLLEPTQTWDVAEAFLWGDKLLAAFLTSLGHLRPLHWFPLLLLGTPFQPIFKAQLSPISFKPVRVMHVSEFLEHMAAPCLRALVIYYCVDVSWVSARFSPPHLQGED